MNPWQPRGNRKSIKNASSSNNLALCRTGVLQVTKMTIITIPKTNPKLVYEHVASVITFMDVEKFVLKTIDPPCLRNPRDFPCATVGVSGFFMVVNCTSLLSSSSSWQFHLHLPRPILLSSCLIFVRATLIWQQGGGDESSRRQPPPLVQWKTK